MRTSRSILSGQVRAFQMNPEQAPLHARFGGCPRYHLQVAFIDLKICRDQGCAVGQRAGVQEGLRYPVDVLGNETGRDEVHPK